MMKKITLFALLIAGLATANAQWSNSTNQFYDSLDMAVGIAGNEQVNPLVIKSESDGGYFVIWEDYREGGQYSADIYAQKYDKAGKALWAANGIPVASGATNQQYSISKNGGYSGDLDYRNVSHAASDGAGGFYIAYSDYLLISPYDYSRVCVQHVLGDGSVVFGQTGYIIGNPSSATSTEYSSPQLIADGKGGFFIGYARGRLQQSQGNMQVWVYCYKDEGGSLKQYGGGQMNVYGTEISSPAACGTKYDIDLNRTFATSFVIFPDLQNGCGVAMIQQLNVERNIITYNRLCRVKKDCHTSANRRVNDLASSKLIETDYKKDSVVTLFKYATYSYTVSCRTSVIPEVIVEYTCYRVENGGQGLKEPTDPPAYALWQPNAKVIPTDGNIDVCLITWNQRDLTNNTVGSWYTRSKTLRFEKYDSLPYQLCTDLANPYFAYRPDLPDGVTLNKLNTVGTGSIDTLVKTYAVSSYEYTLAASGNRLLLATTNMRPQTGTQWPLYYQELTLNRITADSFALQLATPSQNGTILGYGEAALGQFSVKYLNPVFATDGKGNALFYIGEYQNYIRVSPVGTGGKLLWGAMGAPISAAIWKGRYTNPGAPFVYMDTAGKAVVAWQDAKQTLAGSQGNNIYIRHLDSLVQQGYQPPLRTVRSLTAGSGSSIGIPQVLNGSSNTWTPFFTGVFTPGVGTSDYSVTAAIKDDNDLGTVTMQTYENKGATRYTANGKPYLNRNYTISVTNHPAGASIHVRLMFTKAEFNALKAADPSINDPGDLSVIKQTNTGGSVPATYTPVAGELGLTPIAWAAIDTSGYYIEVVISDFSNFFIMRAGSVLPVTLQSFTIKATDNKALLQWETASELNNDHFDIERSADGRLFTKIGRVQGYGTSGISRNYSFTDAAPFYGTNYYRLVQVDLDGKIIYSQIRLLSFSGQVGLLKVFPNPVISTLHIQLPQTTSGQDALQLYDLTGLKVLVHSVSAGTLQSAVDITTLAPGTYILRYGNENVKVVKQ